MQKMIGHWSYWLGIACLVIALAWRTVNAFGFWLPLTITPGHTIWYLSFFHGSFLFLGTTVATACYAWLHSQKP